MRDRNQDSKAFQDEILSILNMYKKSTEQRTEKHLMNLATGKREQVRRLQFLVSGQKE